MDLSGKLEPVHAHLSNALMALSAALPETIAADNQRVQTIARLLTAAQAELLALTHESVGRGRAASDADEKQRRHA